MREWELSFRLGMRPWIAVAYSAPVAAASAVFLVYPIGQGSFSDGGLKWLAHLVYMWLSFLNKNIIFFILNCSEKLNHHALHAVQVEIIICLIFLFTIINTSYNWNNHKVVFYQNRRNSSVIVKAASDPSPGQEPPNNNENKDNSLLSNNNIVKGKRIPFANLRAQNLTNTPAVYCIRCKENNMYYVGQTNNFKQRFLQHRDRLANQQHENAALQSDWNRYNINSFEFVIVKEGHASHTGGTVPQVDVSVFNTRLSLEKQLQSILFEKNLCYNTGLAETTNPRPTGRYPNQAGVFSIRCTVNNKVFFGYTTQTQGIGGRVRSIVYKLNNGILTNNQFQADWDTYGETAFEILPYHWGPALSNESACKVLVNQLITQAKQKNQVTYNNSLEPVDVDITQVPFLPQMDFVGIAPIIPPPNLENARPINLGANKPIIAEGNTYLSTLEAANCFSQDFNSVKLKLKKGTYRYATSDEILAELVRRGWSTDSSLAIRVSLQRRSPGVGSPVEVRGVIYPSANEAGRVLNLSGGYVNKAIRNGVRGYRRLSQEEAEAWLRENS